MTTQLKIKILLPLFFISLACFSQAQESGVQQLSPELREMLSKEMFAIQEGMMAIIPQYAAGNNIEIAAIARQIKESFVLAKNLTEAQKHELHSKLPASFLALDEQFHYNAGMLQHVAEKNKNELIGFYFSQLSEACAGCHSMYATHKFPLLAPKAVSNSEVKSKSKTKAKEHSGHSH